MASSFKPCSVDECKGNAHWSAKGPWGMCRKHYRRTKAHGSPLAGRTPNGEAERFYNEVVLKCKDDGCLIWPYARTHGYGVIRTDGRTRAVHRLACIAVHGEPPSEVHEAAHSCGKGSYGCVNPQHLSWKTPLENQTDRVEHGTSNRGEACAASKLTLQDVLEIRRLQGEMTQQEIADLFDVNYITVGDIHNRRTWAWL